MSSHTSTRFSLNSAPSWLALHRYLPFFSNMHGVQMVIRYGRRWIWLLWCFYLSRGRWKRGFPSRSVSLGSAAGCGPCSFRRRWSSQGNGRRPLLLQPRKSPAPFSRGQVIMPFVFVHPFICVIKGSHTLLQNGVGVFAYVFPQGYARVIIYAFLIGLFKKINQLHCSAQCELPTLIWNKN